MFTMRTLILFISIVLAFTAKAQWTTGTNINNTNSGSVGIGTTTPAEKLDVNGNIKGKGLILDEAVTTNSGRIFFRQNGITRGRLFTGDGTTTKADLFYQSFDGVGNFVTTALFIENATGKVGLGTNAPRAMLDVCGFVPNEQLGTVLARLGEGNTTGEGTFLGVRGYGTQTTAFAGKSFAIEHGFYGNINSSINFFRGVATTGGYLTFATNNNTEQMRINWNGNVGIGTPAPQAKLAVNGDIFAKKIKVTQSGWPDYVFNETYQLDPLKKVEEYIRQHRHLPGIPSAATIEKDGLDLGNNQAALLRKIEELTLYTIQLEKRVDQLSALLKRVDDLEKAVKKSH